MIKRIGTKDIEETLLLAKSLCRAVPESNAIKSVIQQLEYLAELKSGKSDDRSKLSKINIGVIAAREIEDRDRDLADKLHAISAEVRLMGAED